MTLDDVARELDAQLPTVTLLVGGNQGQARGVAEDAARRHGALASDVTFVRKLTSPSAHSVSRLAWVVPWGSIKVFILSLDGSSELAQDSLLKALESAPESSRFILLASQLPLPAITSRAVVYHVGEASRAATARPDDPAMGKAAAAVAAAKTGDPLLLSGVISSSSWDEECVAALQKWAISQAVVQQLRQGPALEPRVTPRQARTVLKVLADHPRARPVNVAMAALSTAFLEE